MHHDKYSNNKSIDLTRNKIFYYFIIYKSVKTCKFVYLTNFGNIVTDDVYCIQFIVRIKTKINVVKIKKNYSILADYLHICQS